MQPEPTMKPAGMGLRSPFRTARDEARYLAAYDESLRRWPVPFEELDLDGRAGRTHVIASGPRQAPPLLLVHGYGASATMWALHVRALAGRYRVFAVDVPGQAGKSRPRAPLATRADCVAWVGSVLDGLGIDRAPVVGMSYGGWLALNYAIAAPARVRAAVLLSPGGLLPLSRQMGLRAMLASLVPWQRCCDLVLMRWISTRGPVDDVTQRATLELFARQMYLGLRVRGELIRGGAPALPFSDDELRSLRVPTLLLLGQEEVLYDPNQALGRARRLVPGLVGEVIAHASHDLAVRRPDVVDQRLLAFLEGAAPDRSIELHP